MDMKKGKFLRFIKGSCPTMKLLACWAEAILFWSKAIKRYKGMSQTP